jgi:TolA-binding protein
VWKVFAVLFLVFLIVSTVLGFLFFAERKRGIELADQNRILEKQSIESRRIAEDALLGVEQLESDNGQLRGNLEQLKSDNIQLESNNTQLAENNRIIRAEHDRFKSGITDYFNSIGTPP